MQKVITLGFWFGLAAWTFVMGGFYGLINYGGDFVQWLNAAFLGLAPSAFNTLVDALQTAGSVICFVIWLGGVVALYLLRGVGAGFARRASAPGGRGPTVHGPTINGTAREL